MVVIPAIDILNGKAVRLEQGRYDRVTVYNESVPAQAEIFQSLGFGRIHIVDLAGSRDGIISCWDMLKAIKRNTRLCIEFGGGIRILDDVLRLQDVGIDFIVIGSLAIKEPKLFEQVCKTIGADKIIASVDVKGNKVAVHGWQSESNISDYEHINYCSKLGVEQYLCTDISRDGMLSGINIQMYERLQKEFPDRSFIASGGVKSIEDIQAAQKMKLYGIIMGKAWYSGNITHKEILDYAC
ncbi:MAG: 1-(5-phosphoribosyl)-5-[(5-phosphoribosylamino)methylideneamino]imidazole-4-carboxamide isomerase [Ignavibacteria bacterium]|nr:1-(5-phosphoribosyl)-5-[(5-phosphoribosylamino)methylideneamino]imidazole-4-carboxamide isomerase [Ignavibacteria bacterium]